MNIINTLNNLYFGDFKRRYNFFERHFKEIIKKNAIIKMIFDKTTFWKWDIFDKTLMIVAGTMVFTFHRLNTGEIELCFCDFETGKKVVRIFPKKVVDSNL